MIKQRIFKLVLPIYWVAIIGEGLPNVVFIDSLEISYYEEGKFGYLIQLC